MGGGDDEVVGGGVKGEGGVEEGRFAGGEVGEGEEGGLGGGIRGEGKEVSDYLEGDPDGEDGHGIVEGGGGGEGGPVEDCCWGRLGFGGGGDFGSWGRGRDWVGRG